MISEIVKFAWNAASWIQKNRGANEQTPSSAINNFGIRAIDRGCSSVELNTERVLQTLDRGAERCHRITHYVVSGVMGVATCTLGVLVAPSSQEENLTLTIIKTSATGILLVIGIGLLAKTSHLLGFRDPILSQTHSASQSQHLAPSSRSLYQRLFSAIRQPVTIICPADSGALVTAAFQGKLEEIAYLQREGANLEAVDAEGRTALHWAVLGQQRAALDLLWYYGCNLAIPDHHGHFPKDLCSRESEFHTHILKLMRTKNRFHHEKPIFPFYPPENLVYKGGGPKGIVYVGVQLALEGAGVLGSLRRVAGTSAGAINAVLLALNYTGKEMEKELLKTDLKAFLDHPLQTETQLLESIRSLRHEWKDLGLNHVGPLFNKLVSSAGKWREFYYEQDKARVLKSSVRQIYNKGGLCSGDEIRQWIDGLIERKTGVKDCTFGEFKRQLAQENFKHMRLYVTKMNPEALVCIDSEDNQWDDVVISDAVRASMSIPIIFAPHTLHVKLDGEKRKPAPHFGRFIDGGVIKNFPLDAFDRIKDQSVNRPGTNHAFNHQTLGFNLVDSPVEPSLRTDMLGVATSVLGGSIDQEDILIRSDSNNQHRMVNINNLGIGLMTGFFADSGDKRNLIDIGKRSTEAHLEAQRIFAATQGDSDPANLLHPDALAAARYRKNLQQRERIEVKDIVREQAVAIAEHIEDEKGAGYKSLERFREATQITENPGMFKTQSFASGQPFQQDSQSNSVIKLPSTTSRKWVKSKVIENI